MTSWNVNPNTKFSPGSYDVYRYDTMMSPVPVINALESILGIHAITKPLSIISLILGYIQNVPCIVGMFHQ